MDDNRISAARTIIMDKKQRVDPSIVDGKSIIQRLPSCLVSHILSWISWRDWASVQASSKSVWPRCSSVGAFTCRLDYECRRLLDHTVCRLLLGIQVSSWLAPYERSANRIVFCDVMDIMQRSGTDHIRNRFRQWHTTEICQRASVRVDVSLGDLLPPLDQWRGLSLRYLSDSGGQSAFGIDTLLAHIKIHSFKGPLHELCLYDDTNPLTADQIKTMTQVFKEWNVDDRPTTLELKIGDSPSQPLKDLLLLLDIERLRLETKWDMQDAESFLDWLRETKKTSDLKELQLRVASSDSMLPSYGVLFSVSSFEHLKVFQLTGSTADATPMFTRGTLLSFWECSATLEQLRVAVQWRGGPPMSELESERFKTQLLRRLHTLDLSSRRTKSTDTVRPLSEFCQHRTELIQVSAALEICSPEEFNDLADLAKHIPWFHLDLLVHGNVGEPVMDHSLRYQQPDFKPSELCNPLAKLIHQATRLEEFCFKAANGTEINLDNRVLEAFGKPGGRPQLRMVSLIFSDCDWDDDGMDVFTESCTGLEHLHIRARYDMQDHSGDLLGWFLTLHAIQNLPRLRVLRVPLVDLEVYDMGDIKSRIRKEVTDDTRELLVKMSNVVLFRQPRAHKTPYKTASRATSPEDIWIL